MRVLGVLALLLLCPLLARGDGLAHIVTTPRTLPDGMPYLDVGIKVGNATTIIGWTIGPGDDYQAVMFSDDRYDSSGRSRTTGPFLSDLDGFRPVDGQCPTYDVERRAYPVVISGRGPRLTKYRRKCTETRRRLLWRGVCLTWVQARKVGVSRVPVVAPAETIPGCRDSALPVG
jgi:hypothetical protein